MQRRFRFTIGGLMWTVAATALASAVLAAEIRSAPAWDEGRQLSLLRPLTALVLVVDTSLLIRRARGGRPPFGPGWSSSDFALGMVGVAACLWLPFVWMVGGGNFSAVSLLPLTSVLAGAGVLVPFHWLVPQPTPFEMPLVALASTLLIMGAVRLVARQRVRWACAITLPVACFSSWLVYTLFKA